MANDPGADRGPLKPGGRGQYLQERRQTHQNGAGRNPSDQRALDPGRGDAGSAGAEYRFGVGDAGWAMEVAKNADAVWRTCGDP